MKIIKIKNDIGKDLVIGMLNDEEDEFYKVVKKSKHFYKKLNAWGIDADTWYKIKNKVKLIKIYDKEEKKFYVTTPESIESFGHYLHFKPHRAQIFLSLKHWIGYPRDKKKRNIEIRMIIGDNN